LFLLCSNLHSWLLLYDGTGSSRDSCGRLLNDSTPSVAPEVVFEVEAAEVKATDRLARITARDCFVAATITPATAPVPNPAAAAAALLPTPLPPSTDEVEDVEAEAAVVIVIGCAASLARAER
jgi:hypothetical protein